jgi:hypothetical protein
MDEEEATLKESTVKASPRQEIVYGNGRRHAA